jgi:hypothetical protein
MIKSTSRAIMAMAVGALISGALAAAASAQEQSRESMAVDATAAQWSFQFAYEGKFDYRTDMVDGMTRPEGEKGFLQFRFVAPIPKTQKWPITLLPRLTLRAVENQAGDFGIGGSDIFVLGIAQQWSTGRWGIGPQINFPAKEGFGNPNWGFGLAGAVTQRAVQDKLFLALLLQQVWTENAEGKTKAAPININAIIAYQLGGGWYIGNGDYVISYDWDNSAWLVPFLARLGKAWVRPNNTWNAYLEYGTSIIYKDWKGPVPEHILRVNVQFQIPVG